MHGHWSTYKDVQTLTVYNHGQIMVMVNVFNEKMLIFVSQDAKQQKLF